MQNLLLGQAIFNLKDENYNATVANNTYQLKPQADFSLFKRLFLIEPKHFKIDTQQVSQPENQRMVSVKYTNYQQINTYIFPNKITILAQEKGEATTIDIEYKNFAFNEKVTFPYTIPNGYKKLM